MSRTKGVRNGEARAAFDTLAAVETDECVLWPYSSQSNGYGQVGFDGKVRTVHTLACEARHGARPAGMQVAHSCGNRLCLNYRHLRWATAAENNADKHLHGTAQRGENATNVALTEADVRAIRAEKAAGASARSLAAQYGVGPRTILDIHHRRRWGWLDADKAAS